MALDDDFRHFLPAKASNCLVSAVARPAADDLVQVIRRDGRQPVLDERGVPRMAVSRLLKSCATPPASCPTASIFCAWRNCASRR